MLEIEQIKKQISIQEAQIGLNKLDIKLYIQEITGQATSFLHKPFVLSGLSAVSVLMLLQKKFRQKIFNKKAFLFSYYPLIKKSFRFLMKHYNRRLI